MAEGTVDFDNYRVLLSKEIGRGTFGSVYEGYHKKSNTKVAVKKMAIKSSLHGAEGMKEIKLLHRMEAHDNIIRLEDFFYHDTSFWIIMEFCEADLDKHMEKVNPGIDGRIQIMYECAVGLTHMHEQPCPIIHRDIKPANILMKNGVAKLTDLGVSKMVDMDEMMKTMMFATVVGTPGYMAPEQFEKKPYGFAVDCFAMGLVYLAMITYTPGGHLLPLAGEGDALCPVGQDMMIKTVMGETFGPIVRETASDSPQVRKIKAIINSVVKYDPSSRKKMRDIMNSLAQMLGKSVAPAPAPKASRLPTPPPSDEEISSDEDEEDGSGSSNSAGDSTLQALRGAGEGIGFALLHAALAEALGGALGAARGGGLDAMGMLMQALADDKFEPGEKVVVDSDLDRAKNLQKNHGDWIAGMEHYLGMEGTVQDSPGMGIFRIKFPDGQILTWNAELLSKAIDVHTVKPPPFAKKRRLDVLKKFTQYDIVKVTDDEVKFRRLMKEIDCFREDLVECCDEKGIITKIDIDGDIVVSLMIGNRSIRCVFHPDLLIKQPAVQGEVESGDVVYIKEDERELKRLQKGHGGWTAAMTKALGKLAMVASTVEVPQSRGRVAKIEMDGNAWHLNVKALVILAKSEDLFQALIDREVAKRMRRVDTRKKEKCVIQ